MQAIVISDFKFLPAESFFIYYSLTQFEPTTSRTSSMVILSIELLAEDTIVTFLPRGRHTAGFVEQKRTTQGTPHIAARWLTPESFPTYSSVPDNMSRTSLRDLEHIM